MYHAAFKFYPAKVTNNSAYLWPTSKDKFAVERKTLKEDSLFSLQDRGTEQKWKKLKKEEKEHFIPRDGDKRVGWSQGVSMGQLFRDYAVYGTVPLYRNYNSALARSLALPQQIRTNVINTTTGMNIQLQPGFTPRAGTLESQFFQARAQGSAARTLVMPTDPTVVLGASGLAMPDGSTVRTDAKPSAAADAKASSKTSGTKPGSKPTSTFKPVKLSFGDGPDAKAQAKDEEKAQDKAQPKSSAKDEERVDLEAAFRPYIPPEVAVIGQAARSLEHARQRANQERKEVEKNSTMAFAASTKQHNYDLSGTGAVYNLRPSMPGSAKKSTSARYQGDLGSGLGMYGTRLSEPKKTPEDRYNESRNNLLERGNIMKDMYRRWIVWTSTGGESEDRWNLAFSREYRELHAKIGEVLAKPRSTDIEADINTYDDLDRQLSAYGDMMSDMMSGKPKKQAYANRKPQSRAETIRSTPLGANAETRPQRPLQPEGDVGDKRAGDEAEEFFQSPFNEDDEGYGIFDLAGGIAAGATRAAARGLGRGIGSLFGWATGSTSALDENIRQATATPRAPSRRPSGEGEDKGSSTGFA